MSMAINRISASSVAGMSMMPVNKPSRVTRVDSGDRATVVAAGTSSQAVQGISGTQSGTSGTPDQVHAAFLYALAALSSVAADQRHQHDPAKSRVTAECRLLRHTPSSISRWGRRWISRREPHRRYPIDAGLI